MGWIFLLLAGVSEIFYAAAMPRTDGFTKLGPSLFCALFICLSMYLLSLATRTIPVGTAYAVWVGIGGPMTYVSPKTGKQYIVITAGGARQSTDR